MGYFSWMLLSILRQQFNTLGRCGCQLMRHPVLFIQICVLADTILDNVGTAAITDAVVMPRDKHVPIVYR